MGQMRYCLSNSLYGHFHQVISHLDQNINFFTVWVIFLHLLPYSSCLCPQNEFSKIEIFGHFLPKNLSETTHNLQCSLSALEWYMKGIMSASSSLYLPGFTYQTCTPTSTVNPFTLRHLYI